MIDCSKRNAAVTSSHKTAVKPSPERRPVRATSGDFREMEWDVVISWQLRGLRGNYVM